MTEIRRSPDVEPMTHNVEMILDAHTHLTGSEESEQILECMNACAVERAFLFAPELDVETRRLTNDNLDDIRTHNDYCADICSAAPERLLGFCTLNPTPNLADGDIDRAVDLMIEEAHRCYHELGFGVPGSWSRRAGTQTIRRSSGCGRPSPSSGCIPCFTRASSMMGAKAPTAAQSFTR